MKSKYTLTNYVLLVACLPMLALLGLLMTIDVVQPSTPQTVSVTLTIADETIIKPKVQIQGDVPTHVRFTTSYGDFDLAIEHHEQLYEPLVTYQLLQSSDDYATSQPGESGRWSFGFEDSDRRVVVAVNAVAPNPVI